MSHSNKVANIWYQKAPLSQVSNLHIFIVESNNYQTHYDYFLLTNRADIQWAG